MAKIKVHVLNFHSIWSHVELVLENTSTQPHTYYGINRWQGPGFNWGNGAKYAIREASSTYSFDIEAEPNELVSSWKEYWYGTWGSANIVGNNCAVAAQWFLTKFAGIPEPGLSNISLNHLAFGIVWPSLIPCPVTLPGRIMSNVKFHVEAKNRESASQFMHVFLYTSLALATLAIGASIFALSLAATVLTGGLAGLTIVASVVAGAASSYGFFKAYNAVSQMSIVDRLKKNEQLNPLIEQKDNSDDLDSIPNDSCMTSCMV